jgi:serine acetyltransferase
MVREIWRDAVEFTRVSMGGDVSPRAIARAVLLYDPFAVLASTRVREAARRLHLPLVNRLLRIAQTAVYGIEIGKDVELGPGVFFVHPLGTVIGGDARVGARVRFMGSNTVGTAKDNGYPVIEDDVVVGCGARILGPVRVGARAVIGANAVVLHDVPPDAVATGVPAVVRRKGEAQRGERRPEEVTRP